MPSLAVHAIGETRGHLSSIACRGQLAVMASTVDGNHRRANRQGLAAVAVMNFTVVGAIGQQAVDGQMAVGLCDRWQEVGPVVAGAVADTDRGDEIGLVMTDHRDLGPAAIATLTMASMKEVGTDVTTGQAGGVDAGLWRFVDQAAGVSCLENRVQQAVKSPFFSRRRSA